MCILYKKNILYSLLNETLRFAVSGFSLTHPLKFCFNGTEWGKDLAGKNFVLMGQNKEKIARAILYEYISSIFNFNALWDTVHYGKILVLNLYKVLFQLIFLGWVDNNNTSH